MNAQMHLILTLADFKPVAVFQSEQRVHQSGIGVNVRYIQRLGRNVKRLCQRSGHVRFGRSGTILVLRKANICGFLRKAQRHAKVFLCHAPHHAEKVNAFTNRHNSHLLCRSSLITSIADMFNFVKENLSKFI